MSQFCSPDETTQILLAEFAAEHADAILLNHKLLFAEFKETAEMAKDVYVNCNQNVK